MSEEYQQAVIPVVNPQGFGVVRAAIESSFSEARVKDFMRLVDRARIRIRDFEAVLRAGILGPTTANEYLRLGNGDQGQIREFYLASLEQVDPEVRNQFFKLYAYY